MWKLPFFSFYRITLAFALGVCLSFSAWSDDYVRSYVQRVELQPPATRSCDDAVRNGFILLSKEVISGEAKKTLAVRVSSNPPNHPVCVMDGAKYFFQGDLVNASVRSSFQDGDTGKRTENDLLLSDKDEITLAAELAYSEADGRFAKQCAVEAKTRNLVHRIHNDRITARTMTSADPVRLPFSRELEECTLKSVEERDPPIEGVGRWVITFDYRVYIDQTKCCLGTNPLPGGAGD